MTLEEHNAAIAAWSAELGDDIANLGDRKAAYETAKSDLSAFANGQHDIEVVVNKYDTYQQARSEYYASLASVRTKFKSIIDNAAAACAQ